MAPSAENVCFDTLAPAIVPPSIGRSRRLSPEIIAGIAKVVDFVTVLGTAALAFLLYIIFILNSDGADPFALTAVLGSTLFVAGFHAIGGYRFKHLSMFRWQASRVALAWASALAVLLMLGFITKVSGAYSRGWALSWAALTFGLLLLERGILCLAIRRWTQQGYFARNVVVVGAGEPGERLLAKLRTTGDEQIAI